MPFFFLRKVIKLGQVTFRWQWRVAVTSLNFFFEVFTWSAQGSSCDLKKFFFSLSLPVFKLGYLKDLIPFCRFFYFLNFTGSKNLWGVLYFILSLRIFYIIFWLTIVRYVLLGKMYEIWFLKGCHSNKLIKTCLHGLRYCSFRGAKKKKKGFRVKKFLLLKFI